MVKSVEELLNSGLNLLLILKIEVVVSLSIGFNNPLTILLLFVFIAICSGKGVLIAPFLSRFL